MTLPKHSDKLREVLWLGCFLLGFGIMAYINPLLPAAICLWDLGSLKLGKLTDKRKREAIDGMDSIQGKLRRP